MNWLDVGVLAVWLAFLVIGTRMGSIWTASCVLGGFLGAFFADYFALPFAAFLGGFQGSMLLSGIVLFIAGALIVIVPGAILSRTTSALFLGLVDGALGLIAGAVVGLVGISLLLMFAVSLVPRLEKKAVWKRSSVVRPWHENVERLFNDPHFRPGSFSKELKREAMKKLDPIADLAKDKIEGLSEDVVKKLQHPK